MEAVYWDEDVLEKVHVHQYALLCARPDLTSEHLALKWAHHHQSKASLYKGVRFTWMHVRILGLEDVKDTDTKSQSHDNLQFKDHGILLLLYLVTIFCAKSICDSFDEVIAKFSGRKANILLDLGQEEHPFRGSPGCGSELKDERRGILDDRSSPWGFWRCLRVQLYLFDSVIVIFSALGSHWIKKRFNDTNKTKSWEIAAHYQVLYVFLYRNLS